MKKSIAILVLFILTFAFMCVASAEGTVGTVIELTPETVYTVEGDYILSDLNTDILSDALVKEGWAYYYMEGTETGEPAKDWKKAKGSYTTCEVLFQMTNLKDPQEVTFLERCSGYILFNAPDFAPEQLVGTDYAAALKAIAAANRKTELIAFTPLQVNPEQLDSDGYETQSKKAVLLLKDQVVRQSLRADVSKNFYKSWANSAAGENMWALFDYGDGTLYAVDLRTYLTVDA